MPLLTNHVATLSQVPDMDPNAEGPPGDVITHEETPRIASASREIAASAERIFEFIADPAQQPRFDGNDNLTEAAAGQRVRAVGDVFRMTTTKGDVRENRVVEFERGRRIAWRPTEPGQEPPGHLWRWELEPIEPSRTRVTHTYDWTGLTDEKRFARARATTGDRLQASLDRLATLVECAPEECPECGFADSTVSDANAEESVRSLGARYQAALRGEGSIELSVARLRARPEPSTWSALEYAAHMRDVVALWSWGLHRTLTDHAPELPAADPGLPDRAAAEADYNSQDPATVVQELSANAERMARKLATVGSEQWLRTARFGETQIDPLWIVRKVAHEGHHHLLDIEKSLRLGLSD